MIKTYDKRGRTVLKNSIYIVQSDNPTGKFLKDDGTYAIPEGGGGSGNITTITATEDILAYDLITSDGKKADSGNIAHKDKIIGIALADISNGFSGDVQLFGELENSNWNWSVGYLFLNGTSISQTAPETGFSKIIGFIKNNITIIIDLQESILI